MEIFGVPVYLNFLSVVCISPLFLGAISAGFVTVMRDKSPNARAFIAAFILTGLFIGTYGAATSILDPVGAFHRWFTVALVLPVLAVLFIF